MIITQQSLSWLPLQIWWIRNDFPPLYSSYPSKMSSTFSWFWRTYSHKLLTAIGSSADNSSAVFNMVQRSEIPQTSRNLINSKRLNFLRIFFLPFAQSTATFWVKVDFPIPGLPYTRIRLRMGWSSSPSNTSLLSPSFFFVFPSGFLYVKTLTVCKCH